MNKNLSDWLTLLRDLLSQQLDSARCANCGCLRSKHCGCGKYCFGNDNCKCVGYLVVKEAKKE